MQKNKRFWYLDKESQQTLRKNIVSYLLYGPVLYLNKRFYTIEEVNELNRDEMAERFYRSDRSIEDIREKCDRNEINYYELLDDMAAYIDLKLPGAWLRKKSYKENGDRIFYRGIEQVPGAVFKWPENYDIEKLMILSLKSINNQPTQ